MRFASHRDVARAFERPAAARLDGIDVIDVPEDVGRGGPGGWVPPVPGGSGGSSPRAGTAFGHLEASEWRVVLPGVGPAAAQRAVADFLTLGEAPVERLTDKGVRRLDARAAVVEMSVVEMSVVEVGPTTADPDGGQRAAVTGYEGCAILRMVVLHTAPAVRPEDVLTALREQAGIVPSSPPMTTRMAQGPRARLTGDPLLTGDKRS